MHSTTCPGARTSSKQPAPSCRRIFRQKPPYATICPHLPPSGAETGLHRRSSAHVNSHRNELAIPANPRTWAVLLPWMGAGCLLLGRLSRRGAFGGLLRRGGLVGRPGLGRRNVGPMCGDARLFGGLWLLGDRGSAPFESSPYEAF